MKIKSFSQMVFPLFLFMASVSIVSARYSVPAEWEELPVPALKDYLQKEVELIQRERPFSNINSPEEWKAAEPQLRDRLYYMLGLSPLPERGDMKVTITETRVVDGIRIDDLHYQPIPNFYVTANLYRPENTTVSLPAVLYVCGHKSGTVDGVRAGNKSGYQHHGSWYARNGYVCMVIDTYELGEFPMTQNHRGTHQGTRGKLASKWWWFSRGYTPGGVEAWSGIRAIDYLVSLPQVDASRIGVTGRSGGGGYSWMISALDKRVTASVPVAGITDLQNQVVNGCIDGHCDCMFHLNIDRWDFSDSACLSSDRDMLLLNTDSDRLFPLDGVLRIFDEMDKKAPLQKGNVGLGILPGAHGDFQDVQAASFRWMNLNLRDDEDDPIEPSSNIIDRKELKVFDELPADAINGRIHELFVPMAKNDVPADRAQWEKMKAHWLDELAKNTFNGWPKNDSALATYTRTDTRKQDDTLTETWRVITQHDIQVTCTITSKGTPQRCTLHILAKGEKPAPAQDGEIRLSLASRWSGYNSILDTRIRRRHMLIGQTVDGMRVYDIRRVLQLVRSLPDLSELPLTLQASGLQAVNALYASLYEPPVNKLTLNELPATHMDKNAPDYLNVLRTWDIPQAVAMAAERGAVEIPSGQTQEWDFALKVNELLEWNNLTLP